MRIINFGIFILIVISIFSCNNGLEVNSWRYLKVENIEQFKTDILKLRNEVDSIKNEKGYLEYNPDYNDEWYFDTGRINTISYELLFKAPIKDIFNDSIQFSGFDGCNHNCGKCFKKKMKLLFNKNILETKLYCCKKDEINGNHKSNDNIFLMQLKKYIFASKNYKIKMDTLIIENSFNNQIYFLKNSIDNTGNPYWCE